MCAGCSAARNTVVAGAMAAVAGLGALNITKSWMIPL
ncbi:hypothetical protein ATK36_4249 [Amycolatopsis sulphurea]|uniref:Uncharacterized protein n=1 Tax=Amycolatopsis sulphurea TaxID=76022 RepID=A0A2A9FEE7_9PSEU|nr:hypothetical protein ATK36_4249 [Amycolatopsis sulphurea]